MWEEGAMRLALSILKGFILYPTDPQSNARKLMNYLPAVGSHQQKARQITIFPWPEELTIDTKFNVRCVSSFCLAFTFIALSLLFLSRLFGLSSLLITPLLRLPLAASSAIFMCLPIQRPKNATTSGVRTEANTLAIYSERASYRRERPIPRRLRQI